MTTRTRGGRQEFQEIPIPGIPKGIPGIPPGPGNPEIPVVFPGIPSRWASSCYWQWKPGRSKAPRLCQPCHPYQRRRASRTGQVGNRHSGRYYRNDYTTRKLQIPIAHQIINRISYIMARRLAISSIAEGIQGHHGVAAPHALDDAPDDEQATMHSVEQQHPLLVVERWGHWEIDAAVVVQGT